MNNDEKTPERPRLLRLILIGLFLYGGFSYSLSLMEYTFFQVSGQPVFGVTQTYTDMSDTQREQLIRDCGTHLLGANGLGTVAPGSPVVVRCGRFWPFYRYSLQVPADPAFPGVEVRVPDASQADSAKRAGRSSYVTSVRLINYVTMLLSVALVAASAFALYVLVRRRDEQAAHYWSLRAFVGSVLVVAIYLGMMGWATPHFALGW